MDVDSVYSANGGLGMANQLKVQLGQVAKSTSEATIRTHSVYVDRPQDKGGTDKGPMGGELFLASIGGCFMSNLLAAISARKANISDVRTEVVGMIVDAPARFSSVELQVTAKGPIAELEKLVEVADRGCIMMNTLRGKFDVHIRTTVTV